MSGGGEARRSAVTIADVARAAGVSASTVSYVLSGNRPISAATQQRVQRSIEDLGFRPNAGARALASKKTNILALVVPLRPDNDVPVVMQFVSAVATAALSHQHDVLLITESEGPQGVRRVSQSSLVDAVIVMDVQADEPRLPLLRETGLPFVLIGTPNDPGGLVCVDLDFVRAAQLCVDHLADLGHTAVTLLGAAPAVYARRSGYALAFAAGFRAATTHRAMSATTSPIGPSYEMARRTVLGLLADRPQTTALVVHNEGLLGGVLSTLKGLGLDVPRDISVVAVCPDDLAVNQSVELTNVAVPAMEIGTLAVDMMMGQLNGSQAPEVRLVSPHMTVRGSTAPARASA